MSSSCPESKKPLTRETFWREHLQHWQASGQPMAAYCRDRELVYHQFTYWHSKLHQSDELRSVDKSGFVSVRLEESIRTAGSDALTLALPNGVRVENVTCESIPVIVQLLSALR